MTTIAAVGKPSTAARAEIVQALEHPAVTPRTAGALRSALRLIDTVAEHESSSLHEEAVRVAREALEHAFQASKVDV